MSEWPTIALGVVAFQDAGSLDTLLTSARGFDEVVVVNVTDCAEVAAVCRQHEADVVSCAENVGFAAAVNALARRSSADRLLFTNDDLVLCAGVADACRRSSRPVTVPKLTTGERDVRSIRALPTIRGLLLEWILLPDHGPVSSRVQKWRAPTQVEPVLAAVGAAVLCDRELLQRVPMPEAFFMYWEEMEWFWTLADLDVPVVYDPSIVVVRHGGPSEFGTAKWGLLGANLVRLGGRRLGVRGRVLYAALALCWLFRSAVLDSLRPDRAVRWRARASGARGVLRSLVHPA